MEKWDKGGREAAGDGTTSCSVKAFHFDDISTPKKGNIRVKHM